MVVTRRCNLSCGYCNEYDEYSQAISVTRLGAQIAALKRLRTAVVTCTGGEPLLHPQIADVIGEIRRHDMIATMITNGYRLNRERIARLNESGLLEMQISIDNLQPDDSSMKSLSSVEKKLALLAEFAQFKVNINSVLGISEERTEEVLVVAERARQYGFHHSVGILHDGNGALKPLSDRQFRVYRELMNTYGSFLHRLNHCLFQRNLVAGKSNNWKCRAGARYLYICEDGMVHWCSQRRGYPGIPLLEYTRDDISREFDTRKRCSANCTLSCVHQISAFDEWRRPQSRPDPLSSS